MRYPKRLFCGLVIVAASVWFHQGRAETALSLDPRAALIVVDLQKGIVARAHDLPIDSVIHNAALLAAEFRGHNLPVVLVNTSDVPSGRTQFHRTPSGQRPPDWADLVPELNRQAGDHAVTKKGWSAFTNTDLLEYLKQQGVSQIVLTGVATSIGVESTARQAYELGFNVTLVTDAMTDPSPEAQENSVSRVFPRLGEIGGTQQIVDLLVPH